MPDVTRAAFRYFIASLRGRSSFPETTAPFPQRWGWCEKGRLVFRREDRVDRFTVAKNEVAESIFRRRWWRLLEYHIAAVAGSALRHRVIRRHSEERRGWLGPLNIRQCVSGLAELRVAPLAHHRHLQIIGVPVLGNDGNRLFVSDLSRRNGARVARSLRAHASDRLRSQVLLFQRAVSDRLLLVILNLALDRIPHRTIRRAFHRSKVPPHLLGRLCVGV